ncbi:MAG: acyl-CoA thioesterase [Sphingomonadaceae bacterium]
MPVLAIGTAMVVHEQRQYRRCDCRSAMVVMAAKSYHSGWQYPLSMAVQASANEMAVIGRLWMNAVTSLRREDYRHALPIPVRWADCDAYGHVNNAIYYAMMDQVVTVYILEKGIITMGTSPSIGLCVSSACEFHQSLEFPDIVDARLRVGRIGGKSVRYEVGLFRDGIEEPASTGHFVHVYVDRQTRKPVNLTQDQRDALMPLLVDQN